MSAKAAYPATRKARERDLAEEGIFDGARHEYPLRMRLALPPGRASSWFEQPRHAYGFWKG
jgi:hypothetical protein